MNDERKGWCGLWRTSAPGTGTTAPGLEPAHQDGASAYFQAQGIALVHHAPGARSYLSVIIGSL